MKTKLTNLDRRLITSLKIRVEIKPHSINSEIYNIFKELEIPCKRNKQVLPEYEVLRYEGYN